MITIHATQKLIDALPLNDQGQLPIAPNIQPRLKLEPLANNPLSNWHAHFTSLQRCHVLLFVHDETRFPLIVTGIRKTDLSKLNYFFEEALMSTLMKCDANNEQLDAVLTFLRPLQFDRETNRSVLGTLNRVKSDIEFYLQYEQVNIKDISPSRLGALLAESPSSAKGKGYLFPKSEMLALLESQNEG